MNSSELDDFVKQLPKLSWKQVMIINTVLWRSHRLWRTKEQYAAEKDPLLATADYRSLEFGLCINFDKVGFYSNEAERDAAKEIMNSWPRSAKHVESIGPSECPQYDFYIVPSDVPGLNAQQRYSQACHENSMLVGDYGADRINLLKFFIKKRVKYSGFLKSLFLRASIVTASKDYKIG